MAANRYLTTFLIAVLLTTGPVVSAVSGNVALAAEEASKRINIAGRQRMLSQQMVNGLCFALSNVNAEKNKLTNLPYTY